MIGAESIKSKVCSDRSAPGIISVQRDYGCNRPAMLGNEGGMAIFSCFPRIWELVSGVFGSSARCFAHGLPVNEPSSSVRAFAQPRESMGCDASFGRLSDGVPRARPGARRSAGRQGNE